MKKTKEKAQEFAWPCPAVATWIVGISAVALLTMARAAPFENLGFDSPKVFQESGGVGSTADVLPGWELFYNDAPQTTVVFNYGLIFPFDDVTTVALWDRNHGLVDFIEGPYALNVSETRSDSFSLVQRGDVPEGLPFLALRAVNYWELSINGKTIQPVLDTVYGPGWRGVEVFDLSKYLGQNIEMRLRAPPVFIGAGNYWLDSIKFEVPEPRIGTLLILGLGLLIGRMWKQLRDRWEGDKKRVWRN